ncbi:hypothetical protein [Novosphingobium sp. KA1]|uniref:hypothetical protein n=1 Tax=Novosphingobium sp. (strain KA1) TaxID=164608 RepID=UPI001A8C4A3F|nr:hypothetical protein [Novosphingobium sp. KA1]QSR18985.1 hypothetical protein CA833_0005 [Novosphingobium sp. KA1]
MDIASGIAAVTQGLGIAKALRGIEKSYDEATYRAKVAEVIEALTDAKLALAEAKEVMAGKDREISRLKIAFEDNGKLAKGPGDYDYKTDDEGRPIGYPICPKCQPTSGRIVQLKQKIHHYVGQCPVCESSFSPVTAFLRYDGDKPYTKADEHSQRVAEASRKNSELMRGLGRTLA